MYQELPGVVASEEESPVVVSSGAVAAGPVAFPGVLSGRARVSSGRLGRPSGLSGGLGSRFSFVPLVGCSFRAVQLEFFGDGAAVILRRTYGQVVARSRAEGLGVGCAGGLGEGGAGEREDPDVCCGFSEARESCWMSGQVVYEVVPMWGVRLGFTPLGVDLSAPVLEGRLRVSCRDASSVTPSGGSLSGAAPSGPSRGGDRGEGEGSGWEVEIISGRLDAGPGLPEALELLSGSRARRRAAAVSARFVADLGWYAPGVCRHGVARHVFMACGGVSDFAACGCRVDPYVVYTTVPVGSSEVGL